MDDEQRSIRLCEEVEKWPELYDVSCVRYISRVAQYTAWVNISKKLNRKVTDCRTRWKSIRDSYIKSKKMMACNPSAHKQYFLAPYLYFLDDCLELRKCQSDTLKKEARNAAEPTTKVNATEAVTANDMAKSVTATDMAQAATAEVMAAMNRADASSSKRPSSRNLHLAQVVLDHFQVAKTARHLSDEETRDMFLRSLGPMLARTENEDEVKCQIVRVIVNGIRKNK